MYDFGKGKALEKIRHTLTPTVGFTYRPDFSDPKYGYYKTVQSDTLGNTTLYSPFSNVWCPCVGTKRLFDIQFGADLGDESKKPAGYIRIEKNYADR